MPSRNCTVTQRIHQLILTTCAIPLSAIVYLGLCSHTTIDRNGLSTHPLSRTAAIQQQCGWRTLKRLRYSVIRCGHRPRSKRLEGAFDEVRALILERYYSRENYRGKSVLRHDRRNATADFAAKDANSRSYLDRAAVCEDPAWTGGSRKSLGIRNHYAPKNAGLTVTYVSPGSPAHEKLHPHDRISLTLAKTLAGWRERRIDKLIVDLRNNGGVFIEGLRLAELFIGLSGVLLQTMREGENHKRYVFSHIKNPFCLSFDWPHTPPNRATIAADCPRHTQASTRDGVNR